MRRIFWTLLLMSFSFKEVGNDCVSTDPSPFVLSSPVRSPISMTGSFGELRNNHFHAGIDIRSATGVGGDEILAAATGFVRKISISSTDYGKSIYIEHPNGYTTLYAHLEKFRPDLDAAVKTHQYKVQKFETDIDFGPKDWPVTVGDVIGYMGDTGASKGAHLHFELRETNSSEVLDPAEYGIPIQDNIAPLIRRVKLYGFDSQGNESSSQVFYASKLNKSTHLISIPGDMFSLGVDALDRSNNSWNWTGVKSIEMKVDGIVVYQFSTDRWSLEDTRCINAHIDYPSKLNAQGQFQRCFKLKGNHIGLYKVLQNEGTFLLADGFDHNVSLTVKDSRHNESSVHFLVRKVPYSEKTKNVDLDQVLHYDTDNLVQFQSGYFHIPAGSLYDNSYCRSDSIMNSSSMALCNWIGCYPGKDPLHGEIEIALRPTRQMDPGELDKCFVAVKRGSSYVSCGGKWVDGYLKSTYKSLGYYSIMMDTVAPRIAPIAYKSNMRNNKYMSFRIQDNIPALGSAEHPRCDAYLDGQWILMEYDAKNHLIKHQFEDWLSPGKHELILVATDDRQNSRSYTYNFIR